MISRRSPRVITGTSPAAPGTAAIGSIVDGLTNFSWFTVHAKLLGATGGTLDLVLQREIVTDVWSDWIAFAQLAAGAAAIEYAVEAGQSSSVIYAAKGGTLATPVKTLAAGTSIGGHPGERVRLVGVAGASTSAGATQTVYLVGWANV